MRGISAGRITAGLLSAVLLVAACGADGADTATTSDDSGGDEAAAEMTDDGAVSPSTTIAAGTARADSADGDTTAPGVAETSQQAVGLQAGSVDDNETWEDYLRYREAFAAFGIAVDDLPVAGRRVLTVTDSDGAPVHDARITVTGGPETVTLRTGTDGRAVYLAPVAADDDQQSGPDLVATVEHGDASVAAEINPEQHQTIVLDGAGRSDGVRLDVLFLVDATGSMDDEIERLKANMVGVAERIGESAAQPDVRFSLTSYRDAGEDYVSRTVDFTSDVSAFVATLRGLSADGGGDYPEAVNEAFAEAVHAPSWRLDDDVVRLVFLVGDAPPHIGRGASYADTAVDAAARGIRVFPIASSGTDDQAEFVFRQIAQATLGRFVFLSYGADGAGGAAVGPGSNIDPTAYDVLAVDDLVVRIVEEQLAPLVDA